PELWRWADMCVWPPGGCAERDPDGRRSWNSHACHPGTGQGRSERWNNSAAKLLVDADFRLCDETLVEANVHVSNCIRHRDPSKYRHRCQHSDHAVPELALFHLSCRSFPCRSPCAL